MDHITTQGTLIGALVAWLIAAVFVYFAGRIVVHKDSYGAALISVFIGSFLASLVQIGGDAMGLPFWLNVALAIAAVGLVIATFYRAKWIQGALIGVVAALLWALVQWIIARLF